jgi:hypothetical protein
MDAPSMEQDGARDIKKTRIAPVTGKPFREARRFAA